LQSQNLDGKEVWLRFPGTGEFSYRGLDPSVTEKMLPIRTCMYPKHGRRWRQLLPESVDWDQPRSWDRLTLTE